MYPTAIMQRGTTREFAYPDPNVREHKWFDMLWSIIIVKNLYCVHTKYKLTVEPLLTQLVVPRVQITNNE